MDTGLVIHSSLAADDTGSLIFPMLFIFAVMVVIYNCRFGFNSIHLSLFVGGLLCLDAVCCLTCNSHVVKLSWCANVDWMQAEDDTASNSVSCSYLPRGDEGKWLAAHPYSSTEYVTDINVDVDAHADSTSMTGIDERML